MEPGTCLTDHRPAGSRARVLRAGRGARRPVEPRRRRDGGCLFRLGRGAEAIATYDRALDAAPSAPDALRGKARALVRLGRPKDALPLYARLLARAPANAELARERAETLRAAGREP
ncbi:MAG: tetratricopeptide repeat protein [Vicinamibacteria bacterium]